MFRQRDRWQRGLIGSLLRNTTFRFAKGIAMQLIAMPYILAFDVIGPVLWSGYILRVIVDTMVGKTYNIVEQCSWIILFLIYLGVEITIDLLTEVDRAELDLEKISIGTVIAILLMQIPKIIIYMFVIMPARVWGTLTYTWRKNVW